MGLTEFVAWRDVGDTLIQIQIPEPRRLADVEMIDRMQVVVEARQRHLTRAQAAAVGEPPVHQENVEAGAGKITPKDQPVMARADDDAVVGFLERFGHG